MTKKDISDDVMAQLKSEHGVDLFVYSTEDTTIVFRKPKRAEHKRFLDQISSDKSKADAMEIYVRGAVVYPDKADFSSLLDEYAGLIEVLAGEIASAARNQATTEAKKA